MSALILKLLAYLSMTYDHVGFCLNEPVFRGIGRLAMPLFCYFIAQGMRNTRSLPRYILRLSVLAILAEIPFNLFISGSILHIAGQNVIWTLLIGLVCIALGRELREKKPRLYPWLYPVIILIGCMIANFFVTDYNYYGVLLVVIFDLFPMQTASERVWGTLAVVGLNGWRFVSYGLYLLMKQNGVDPLAFTPLGRFFLTSVGDWELIKLLSLLALPLIWLYNGKKGSLGDKRMDKWLGHLMNLYYPLHLLVLALIYSM